MMKQNYQKIRKPHLQILQWMIYAILLVVCYIWQTSGSMIKPLLLIPIGLCIASHMGEIRAMLIGAACGVLLDLACGKLIGSNAICMILLCVGTSLLYHYLLKQKWFNMLWLTALCALIQGGMDYLFYYVIWEHENVSLIWENIILPSCWMTALSSVPIYFIIHGIAETCGSYREQKLEKASLSYPESKDVDV